MVRDAKDTSKKIVTQDEENITDNEMQQRYWNIIDEFLTAGFTAEQIKRFRNCYNKLTNDGMNAVIDSWNFYAVDITGELEVKNVAHLCYSLANNPKYCWSDTTPYFNIPEASQQINITDEEIDNIAKFTKIISTLPEKYIQELLVYSKKLKEQELEELSEKEKFSIPCNIGDTVFLVTMDKKITTGRIECFHIVRAGVLADIMVDDIEIPNMLKSEYFLTREEAEEKIKERQTKDENKSD